MRVKVSVDVDGMAAWNEALRLVKEEGPTKFERVVGKGCSNIKRTWRERWGRGFGSHIPHIKWSINYDVTRETETHIVGEVGADRLHWQQGVLAHIIEFGNLEYGNLRNAPIPGGLPALKLEEPLYVNAVGDLAEQLLTDDKPR